MNAPVLALKYSDQQSPIALVLLWQSLAQMQDRLKGSNFLS